MEGSQMPFADFKEVLATILTKKQLRTIMHRYQLNETISDFFSGNLGVPK